MQMKEIINKALNEQINKELFSSYLYLSMAAWFESVNLKGFASWMKLQSAEEHKHAMKIFGYVSEAGGRVELAALQAPKKEWNSAQDAIEETCKHEAFITSSIYSLVELARKENDYAAQNMLQWFVAEQVEEESTAGDILARIKMIGSSMGSLLYLDKELGKRA